MKFWNIFTRGKPETPAPVGQSLAVTRESLPPLPDDVARSAASMLSRMGVTDLGELNKKMFRSYEAAVTTSYNADFRGTYGSANAEILISNYLAVARSRTLAKDAPHGKAAIRTFQNNVIGRGFRLKMRVGKRNKMPSGKTRFIPEEDTNRQIEQEYKIAGRPENFSVRKNMSRMEAFRILEASAVRDGSGYARHYRAFPFNKYGYAVDILENDHLDRSYMGKSERGNPIRFSIEFDKTWNFPVYYWPLTRHPGEPFGFSTYVTPGGDPKNWREEVPAADIIHYNNLRDRAEQDVGMTELDAAVQCMHRDRQYNTALALAAISSCCKPYWIKKTFPTGMQYTAEDFDGWLRQLQSNLPGPQGTAGGGSSGAAASQQRIGARTDINSPASTIEMEYGQELEQIDPKFPIEAAHEFKADNIREMAVALGISYQSISGDFQNLGFSASRSCEIPQRDNFKVRQENFIDVVVRPHFREWLRAAIMSGVIGQPIARLDELVEAAHFQGVRWPFVNPLQDIQATILQLEAGLISPQQIQDELEDGVSVEDLYAMLAEAKEMQEEHGLDFTDNDPTMPTIKKGIPDQTMPSPDDSDEAQPTPKTQAPNPSRSRKRGISPQTAALLATQGDGRNGHHF